MLRGMSWLKPVCYGRCSQLVTQRRLLQTALPVVVCPSCKNPPFYSVIYVFALLSVCILHLVCKHSSSPSFEKLSLGTSQGRGEAENGMISSVIFTGLLGGRQRGSG